MFEQLLKACGPYITPEIVLSSVLNGLTTGATYALIALGLTLIYGVLHIINFAHGALLMAALYGVWWLWQGFGLDPYWALLVVPAVMFALGYGLQRGVIGGASHGRDENILLVTLGLSIVIENLALWYFQSDTRRVETAYEFATVELWGAIIPYAKAVAFGGAIATAAALWALIRLTDLGRAIRALAREKKGAQLVGIDVAHIHGMSFGIGIGTLGIAACLLMPSLYVSPSVGHGFVLIAFTIVVLGGMGSFTGALLGGLIIGVVEALGGLCLGESLGQIGIFLIFILILLFRPQGIMGHQA